MVAKGTGQEKWGDGGKRSRVGVWVCFSVFIFSGAFPFQSMKRKKRETASNDFSAIHTTEIMGPNCAGLRGRRGRRCGHPVPGGS